MKRILVIENDSNLNEENHGSLLRRLRDLKETYPENEVTIITNLITKNEKEIFSEISKTDILLCMPTFTDQQQASDITSLLGKITKSLEVFILYYNTNHELRKICDPEQFYNVRHHKIFDAHLEDTPLDFSDIWIPFEKEKIKQEEYILSRKVTFTGRKIKILNIKANGFEFDKLKEGQIVDELDCREIDPDPKRGTWVWGVTEPVKLLNDSGYNEFEIAEEVNIKTEVTLEEMIDLIKKSISTIPSDEKLSKEQKVFLIELLTADITDQDKAWEIVDYFEMERRSNRQMFLQMFNKYKPKTTLKVA